MHGRSDEKAGAHGKTRGPSRIESVPKKIRHIPGAECLTTAGQVHRLVQYLEVPASKRPAWVRLGCSVSHCERGSHSTWAVTINGKVEVLFRKGDPRSTWKWVRNAARPWNLERAFVSSHGDLIAANSVAPKPSHFAEARRHYVALFEVENSGDSPNDIAANFRLKPDNESVQAAHARKIRSSSGAVEFLEFLVLGRNGWWDDESLAIHLFTVREISAGEIFAGEDGCVWVSPETCVPFPQYSWADLVLTAFNGQRVHDPVQILRQAAEKVIMDRIAIAYEQPREERAQRAIRFRVQLLVRRLDLAAVSRDDLYRSATQVMEPKSYTPVVAFARQF